MSREEIEKKIDIAIKGGHFDNAIDLLTSLIADNTEDGKLYVRRAECYLQDSKFRQALIDAQTALSLGEESVELALVGGRAATKLAKMEEAYKFYKTGVKLETNNAELVTDLKNLQKIILKDYELEGGDGTEQGYNAIDFCTQTPYPGDDELLKLEKEILSTKFKIDDTIPWCDLEDDSFKEKASCAALEAHRYMLDGKLREALKHFTFAVELEPDNAILRRLRAEVYYLMEDKSNALRDLFAVPKTVRTLDIWRLGGQILHEINMPVTAEVWLKLATKLAEGKDMGVKVLFQKARAQRLFAPLTKDTSVRVDFNDYGKAVVATRRITAGDVIFTDTPLVMGEVLDKNNELAPTCDQCTASLLTPEMYFGEQLSSLEPDLKDLVEEYWPKIDSVSCENCGKVNYCSEECRKEAWISHHEFICPARNEATKKLHEICRNLGWGYNKNGEWCELWEAHFSPMIIARMWAGIVAAAKYMAKEAGQSKPALEHWAKAKSPYRQFIAFGSSSAANRMSVVLGLLSEIFIDCGDGVEMQITDADFNGRFYQAMCNLQSFSSPVTPYHRFMTNIADNLDPQDDRGIRMLKYLQSSPPLAKYCGMFPLHACINHSCFNNVEVTDSTVNGYGGIKVVAKYDIREGDELCTTYIDTSMPRKLRRAWLYRSFNFWCQCARCQFEGDGPEYCNECKKKAPEDTQFSGCGKCHKAWYCSVQCQREAWKRGHKKVCKVEHSKAVN